jgi:hypothetical protein
VTRGWGGILLVVATSAVGAAVVAGISILGSPTVQRQQRLDSARVEDLTTIERLMSRFAALHKGLPRDLASLVREPGFSARTHDPESGVPYDYQTLGADSYLLCAAFRTRSSETTLHQVYGQPLDPTWAHGIGRQCFTRSTSLPIERHALP